VGVMMTRRKPRSAGSSAPRWCVLTGDLRRGPISSTRRAGPRSQRCRRGIASRRPAPPARLGIETPRRLRLPRHPTLAGEGAETSFHDPSARRSAVQSASRYTLDAPISPDLGDRQETIMWSVASGAHRSRSSGDAVRVRPIRRDEPRSRGVRRNSRSRLLSAPNGTEQAGVARDPSGRAERSRLLPR
jgi:hypothetical protein